MKLSFSTFFCFLIFCSISLSQDPGPGTDCEGLVLFNISYSLDDNICPEVIQLNLDFVGDHTPRVDCNFHTTEFSLGEPVNDCNDFYWSFALDINALFEPVSSNSSPIEVVAGYYRTKVANADNDPNPLNITNPINIYDHLTIGETYNVFVTGKGFGNQGEAGNCSNLEPYLDENLWFLINGELEQNEGTNPINGIDLTNEIKVLLGQITVQQPVEARVFSSFCGESGDPCDGQNLQAYDLNLNTNLEYLWSNGSTEQFIQCCDPAGKYSVTITNSDGCTDIAESEKIGCKGCGDFDIGKKLSSNSSKSDINISVTRETILINNLENSISKITVNLYDFSGRLVQTDKVCNISCTSSEISFNTNITSGAYILRINYLLVDKPMFQVEKITLIR